MKHALRSSLFLPLPQVRVFEFFADPANLARITPADMQFRMLSDTPAVMRPGVVIDYRLRVFGLPVGWRSLIERWDPPHEFVDVQQAGPYKSWVHTHRFSEHRGRTHVEDHVEYELPLGPLGELLHRLVARRLDAIFAFRREAIQQCLDVRAEPPI